MFAELGLIIGIVTTAATVTAQERLPVRVQHSGSDRVGVRLSFELKDALASSSRYRLSKADSFDTSAVISIVSLGIETDAHSNVDDALRSALSVQFRIAWRCGKDEVRSETTHMLHLVPANQVALVARDILSSYAEWLEDLTLVACPSLENGKLVFRRGIPQI